MSTFRKINVAYERIKTYEWVDFPTSVKTTLGRKRYAYKKGCDKYLPPNILLQVYESEYQSSEMRVGSPYYTYIGWRDFSMENIEELKDGFYYRFISYDDLTFMSWEKIDGVKTLIGAKRSITKKLQENKGKETTCFGVVQVLAVAHGQGYTSIRPTALNPYCTSSYGSWV